MNEAFEPHWYGDYELLRPLGVGGMAEVFLARTVGAQGFEKVVVLKRMLARLVDQPRFVQMFVSEAKLAVKLAHANIVQILALEEMGGRPFIVMEYVHGRDLHVLLRTAQQRGIEVPSDFVLHCLIEMLRGLAFAHEAVGSDGKPLRLIHRDVTPSNIFISFDGEVKLGDFGVAHSLDGTQGRELRGKYGYIAPEILEHLQIDHRADLFSAGVVLWESLAGRRLFVGQTDGQVLLQIRERLVEPPSQHSSRVPPDLDRIALKALSKDRALRFQTAQEFEDALSDYLFARRLRWTRRRIAEVMKALFAEDAAPLVLPPQTPRDELNSVDDWEDYSEMTTRSLVVKLGALQRTPTKPPGSKVESAVHWSGSVESDPAISEATRTISEPAAPAPERASALLLYAGAVAESVSLATLCQRLTRDTSICDGVGVRDGPHLSMAHFGQLVYWDTLAGFPLLDESPAIILDMEQASLVRVIYEATVRRTSGLFIIESEHGGAQRWLYLKGGYPLYVGSNKPSEGALPMILRHRMLSTALLETAVETSLRRMLPLERALQEEAEGDSSARVERVFSAVLRTRLYPAFAWRRGRVRVYTGVAPQLRAAVRIPPLLGILARAVRRALSVEELKAELVPRSARAVALRQGKASHVEALRLRPEERTVIDAIDGHRNLGEVLHASGMLDTDAQHAALSLLYVLAETGLADMV
ncbi:MAG: serine/threonine-protein kinase [Pseudomonadota bacterium]